MNSSKILKSLALVLLASLQLSAQRFYPDDPLRQEPKPRRVEKAHSRKLSDHYDFFWNTLARPGERQTKTKPLPAQAVNTLGEALDSAWYQNRNGQTPRSLEELLRGPGNEQPPSLQGPWKVVRGKTEGVTPGFTIEDARGRRYLLKFDPPTNPEMATGAETIGSLFFHALGYNVPQYYLVNFDRRQLVLTPKSSLTDALGRRRRMTEEDLDKILLRLPRDRQNRYRASASLFLRGELLGPFRYHGTRKDDPNDVVPHEHRRELRGLYVFCAWLGHDDSRAINTLDTLVEENGLRFIKHYLIDFGSILGSASVAANSPRSGHEYLFASKPAAVQFLTLGLYVPTWARAQFPDLPSVGRFEAEVFDPEKYKTEYPNPAFENRLPDDTFWAAKRVMSFTEEQIRAVVQKGQYSDPRAAEWITEVLIRRRDKVGRTYFSKVLPLDGFQVRGGRLEFQDLAVKYDLAGPQPYAVQWSAFDNHTQRRSPLPGRTSFAIPPELQNASDGQYFAAQIRGTDARKTVTAYLGKNNGQVEVVGLDRTW